MLFDKQIFLVHILKALRYCQHNNLGTDNWYYERRDAAMLTMSMTNEVFDMLLTGHDSGIMMGSLGFQWVVVFSSR